MKELKFECQRCGHCCMELKMKTSAGLLGLYLQLHEVKMFPAANVFPMYGCGQKGVSRPRPARIFAYQLDMQPCPHFDMISKNCRIYANRPIICRSFPLDGIVASRHCPQICSQVEDDEPFTIDQATFQTEKVANILYFRNLRLFQPLTPMWVWPLDKRRWIKKTKDMSEAFFKTLPESVKQTLTERRGNIASLLL